MTPEDIQSFDKAFEELNLTLQKLNDRRYEILSLFKLSDRDIASGGWEAGDKRWVVHIIDYEGDTVSIEAREDTPSKAICKAHQELVKKLKNKPQEPQPFDPMQQPPNQDFVECHLCHGRVFRAYLEHHMRIHRAR